MYVYGLNESIMKLVALCREQKRNYKYLDVVYFARAEGGVVRAIKKDSFNGTKNRCGIISRTERGTRMSHIRTCIRLKRGNS